MISALKNKTVTKISAKKKSLFTAYVSWNGLHYYCTNCTKRTLGFKSWCSRCRTKLKNPTAPHKMIALDRPDLFTNALVERAEKEQYHKLSL